MDKARKKISRRAFVGWFISIGGSVILTSVFGLFYKIEELGQWLIRIVRGKVRHEFHTARDARKSFRAIRPWENPQMVINVSPNLDEGIRIIHWPHSKLFKCRYQVAEKNQQLLEIEDWRKALEEDKACFEKGKSGAILEQLALRELMVSGDDQLEFAGLDKGIEVLRRALSLKENKRSRRLVELIGRLISLTNEKNSDKAFQEFEDLRSTLKIPPVWVTKSNYTPWHTKTVERKHSRFRKKLQARILKVKEL